MIYGNFMMQGHANNSPFVEEDGVHRYNPTDTTRMLRQEFLKHGIEINTPDMNLGRKISFELHIEGRPLRQKTVPRFLIAMENPNINKLNADREYCKQFDLVFAWDKRLHDLHNVIPVMIPHPMKVQPFHGFAGRNIFSCLINANKAFKETLPSDLYRERLKVIKWYEKHAIDKFALYGMGWDKETPSYTAVGKLRRGFIKLGNRLAHRKPFPAYMGEIKDKGDVLLRSKFSWCFENSNDLSNYITEKMMDSLVNGCVPIYWGADNVLDYIPEKCFVDRRKFSNTAAVHEYLLSVTEDEYAEYQRNIQQFLQSDTAGKFSAEYFVSTVVSAIINNQNFRTTRSP